MNGQITITPTIAGILEACRVEGQTLYLPPLQLDRKTYQAVNQVLEALGGQWNRKAKGHVFADDPTNALDAALSTGYAIDPKRAFGFFETPAPVVQQMCELADLQPGHRVLEPSCGHGAIVGEILKTVDTVDVCELREEAMGRTQAQYGARVRVVWGDFLTYQPGAIYDRIVANPPFSRQQDVAHAQHMLDLMKPSSVLVTLLSAGFTFRTDAKTRGLHDRLDRDCPGWWQEELPEGTFKASGTMVRAVLVRAVKGDAPDA